MEVLIGVPAITDLIGEGKTFQIPSTMRRGRKHDMVLLNDALVELVRQGPVSADEAHLKAIDKIGLVGPLKSADVGLPTSTGPADSGG